MIKKPIIIVGSGRSGSTAFARTLSNHRDLVYMTQLTSKIPRFLFLSRLYLRITKLPVIGNPARKIFKLAEAYSLWDRVAGNFSRPRRNIRGEDVLDGDDIRIRKTLAKLLINENSRLLLKLTGWPRIGYMLKIFPDAVFINVQRDGRAVAYSLMNSDFWLGSKGPEGWRLGLLPEDQQRKYVKYNKNLVALAGIYWNILMDALEKDVKDLSPGIMDVKYEEFCFDIKNTMKTVCDFCDLEWYDGFEKSISKNKMVNMNYKWKSELSAEDAEILRNVTSEWCEKLGFKLE